MAYVDFDLVKEYVRSNDEDDDLVRGLITTAEEYLLGAGVAPDAAPYALYEFAIKGIVLHWYENRAAVDTSSPRDFEPGIRTVINQLKFTCGIVSNLDTS